jgi:N-glycosylase/DNA lyase
MERVVKKLVTFSEEEIAKLKLEPVRENEKEQWINRFHSERLEELEKFVKAVPECKTLIYVHKIAPYAVQEELLKQLIIIFESLDTIGVFDGVCRPTKRRRTVIMN